MLILTRRKGERVVIGDAITVSVLGISGGCTRLGISAPTSLSVHREEIYHRIQNELRESADDAAVAADLDDGEK